MKWTLVKQYSPTLIPSSHPGLGFLAIDIWGQIIFLEVGERLSCESVGYLAVSLASNP